MMYRMLGSLAIAGLMAGSVFGGTVTEKTFASTAMSRNITYFLYRPANYDQKVAAGESFSVIYLMHWWAYKADGWHAPGGIRLNPQLDKTIDSVSNIICVAPQDPTNTSFGPLGTGWWVNSGVGQLGTMLSVEMVAEADNTNQTHRDRGHRGLCGASMGGFGTLHHIRVNSDIFRVGYAIVPATDLRNYQSGQSMGCSWGLCSVFSGTAWSENNPIEHISDFMTKDIVIQTQSGNCTVNCPSTVIPDFFYQENVQFGAAMAGKQDFVFHDLPSTGHEYPDAAGMVAILKYFEQHFNSAQPVAPGSKATARSATPATRAKLSVQTLKNASSAQGSYAGIDGRSLQTLPTSGVVIKTK